jgi:hypothetical protein
LIDTFEGAGYRLYADKIRNIACDVEFQSDMECDQLLPQPETYPSLKHEIPSPDKFLGRRSSSYDEFLLIDPDDSQNLSQSKSTIIPPLMMIQQQ